MAATADDLRARALRLLARREYSRQELGAKLLSKPAPRLASRSRQRAQSLADEFAPAPAFTADTMPEEVYEAPTEKDVNALLDDLEKRKMLSDDRYAEMRIRLRAPRYGNTRLHQELSQKGIDRDTIAAVLSEQPDELSRCRDLWLKKFGRAPRDMNERMKQTRHLASRGFAMRTIQQVIRSAGQTGDDVSEA